MLEVGLRALDERGAWYFLGIVAAAALEAGLPADAFSHVPPFAAAIVVVGFAIPFHLPLIALLPVAAVLLHKGLAPSATLALLFAGPAIHLRLLALVAESAGRASAAAVLMTCGVAALATGTATSALVSPSAGPELHALLQRSLPALAPIAWTAATLLLLAIFVSLARLGPRLWLGQLSLLGEASTQPDHDPSHEHDHVDAGG